eukprot:g35879.t1
MAHIICSLPAGLDPLQFAYWRNRPTADAGSPALHSFLERLDNKETYIRLLLIDYSSAFNTAIPTKLISRLRDLGLCFPSAFCILSSLTHRLQSVKVDNSTFSTIILNTSSLQGCILSPLLYSLYTQACVAKFHLNSIFKFADNITVVGQISNNDETEYREETECLVVWGKDKNLSLNISKTKKLIIDFRKKGGGHDPVYINGAEVEMVKSIKFLGVMIINNLSWSTHIDAMVKKTQQCLYFLRRLRKFSMSRMTLTNFYRCTIKSILSECIHSL